MNVLLCDSGPLIATFNILDRNHSRCAALLHAWRGRVMVPEPVLGETCNFLRNRVRNGPQLEAQFLKALASPGGDFEIVNPTDEDRVRAAHVAERFVSAPFGYVDACIVAMAERTGIADIATVDFKFLGMASSVSKLKPLRFVLQES